MTNFNIWTHHLQARIEHVLDQHLPSSETLPQSLHEAMRYSVLEGGKRVRALLAYAAGEFCHASQIDVDCAAAAVELIHAYSLVHDDMPCMDDDDLRRGKPSCHKKFGESTALLVGDALQSLAFQLITRVNSNISPQKQLAMTHLLAIASGSRGMAGGQAIDLSSTNKILTHAELENMHLHKTGALIHASTMLGAMSTAEELSETKHQAITHFAKNMGLAFQVVDDILDIEADTLTLGKTAGKDALTNKSTYVTILGHIEAKQLAQDLYNSGIAALAKFDEEANNLRDLAKYIMQRTF